MTSNSRKLLFKNCDGNVVRFIKSRKLEKRLNTKEVVDIIIGKSIKDSEHNFQKIQPFYEYIDNDLFDRKLALFLSLIEHQKMYDLQELSDGSLFSKHKIAHRNFKEKYYYIDDIIISYDVTNDFPILTKKIKIKEEQFQDFCLDENSGLRVIVRNVQDIFGCDTQNTIKYSKELMLNTHEFDFFGIIVKFNQSENNRKSIKITFDKANLHDNSMLSLIMSLLFKDDDIRKSYKNIFTRVYR